MNKRAIERWDNEGGRLRQRKGSTAGQVNQFSPEANRISLPPFDHKEPVDDDLGLPHHPIYSNYSKYLWTSHRRSGGVQIVNLHGEPPLRIRAGTRRTTAKR